MGLPAPAIGVFMRAMQAEFGWTRAEISLGPTIFISMLALLSPPLGLIADRISAAWLAAFSMLALGLSLFLFSCLGPRLWVYYTAFAVMAVTGCGAGTLVYMRTINANFVCGRGLAIGLVMTGNGIMAVILPMLLTPYAADFGWRQGFVALAIVVAISTPVIVLLLSRSPSGRLTLPSTRDVAPSGKTFGEALRDPISRTMAACFIMVALSINGVQLHFLSILADAHVGPKLAGATAGLAGISLVVGRALSGYLFDRAFAPRVAASMMTISAACIGAMAVVGAPAAALGAIAIGLSFGTELDLMGYLTARYFGMRAFGRIYGVAYTISLAGAALSNVGLGLIYDATKSYTVGLYCSAGLLLLSAVLFLTMRRFAPTTPS